MSRLRVASLVLLSSACGLVLSSGAVGQTVPGTCYVDYFRQSQPCVCETEDGLRILDEEAGAQFCFNDDEELTRLVPNIPPEVIPPEVIPPNTPNPPSLNGHRDNGIGNFLDPAPGGSGITNGDAADGQDSAPIGSPAGAFTDGTAANGDPVGEGNNGNGPNS